MPDTWYRIVPRTEWWASTGTQWSRSPRYSPACSAPGRDIQHTSTSVLTSRRNLTQRACRKWSFLPERASQRQMRKCSATRPFSQRCRTRSARSSFSKERRMNCWLRILAALGPPVLADPECWHSVCIVLYCDSIRTCTVIVVVTSCMPNYL